MTLSTTSGRVADVAPSPIRAVLARATALEAEGRNVLHFEQGRPDFDTPTSIKNAAIQALRNGLVHYGPNHGLIELREAIVAKLRRDNELVYDPVGEIIVTAGVSEAALITFMALLAPGDEIIILEPAWPHYFACAALSGAKAVGVATSYLNGFIPDIDAVERAITPQTRAIVVNSPNNPTGAVYPSELLVAVAEVAEQHDLLIISDEIYEGLVYEGVHTSIGAIEDAWSRTITFNGFSKAYSMTGWRIGYVAAPKPIADQILRVHQYNTVCVTTFAQAGAVEAYDGDQKDAAMMRERFRARRALIIEGFAHLPGLELHPPSGAFYAFPRIHPAGEGHDDSEFCSQLLEEEGVATVPGQAFGHAGKQHLRISYAASDDDIRQALQRLERFATRLIAGSAVQRP